MERKNSACKEVARDFPSGQWLESACQYHPGDMGYDPVSWEGSHMSPNS